MTQSTLTRSWIASANGHSDMNVYNDQTKEVMSVFDMLNEPQRKQAVIVGSPGDGVGALKPKLVEKPATGVGYGDLDESQRTLVATVMRKLLNPFRQEDGEPRVLTERSERLVGAVRARRQPVGAEPDPSEQGDERQLMKRVRIFYVLRGADDGAADARPNSHRRRP